MLKPADDGFFTFAGDKPTEPEEREPPADSEGEDEAVGIEIAELEVSHDLTDELIQANRSAESLSIYREKASEEGSSFIVKDGLLTKDYKLV
ncbi:hypothetical protein N0V85_009998, partial [Neurospora sp. IMI 360204]